MLLQFGFVFHVSSFNGWKLVDSSKDDAKGEKKGMILFSFSVSPTTEELDGKSYLGWYTIIEVWFLNQGVSEHLTKKVEDSNVIERQWKRVGYQLLSLLYQYIDPKLMNTFVPIQGV